MKKFLKTAILSLVLCFTFVFAACGDAVERQFDSKANVNTGNEASYQSTTKESFVGYVNDNTNEAGLTMSGYRMTGTISGSYKDESTTEMINANISYNIIVVENNGVPEMAIKLSMNGTDIYMFAKDGYCYTKMKVDIPGAKGEMKIKSKLPDDYDFSDMDYIGNVVDFEKFFEMLNDGKTNATVTAYVEGETTRYKVEMDYKASVADMVKLSGNYTCYYVFESNKLTGFSMKYVGDSTTMEINFSKYNGKIEYPDFSDYEEVSL